VRCFAWLICAVWLTACGSIPQTQPAADEGAAAHRIYVYSNGWHSSIVLPRHMLPPGQVPEVEDFPEAAFLEFGWGDRTYYPAPDPSFEMALVAAIAPSPAVMHVAGLPRPPQEHYRDVEVLTLDLSTAALVRLVTRIDARFDRPEGGRAEHLAQGLYRDSWFYPAHGEFHLFNTCNTWTARMVAATGVDVSLSGVKRADDLMDRLRELPNVTSIAKASD
jgi:uncharacterized protein (TIGR02117 family)